MELKCPNYNNYFIIFSIICPTEIDPNDAVSIWNIMSKVRVESMMWGIGTALGELPPYFMARAARLSGGGVAELSAKDDSRTGRYYIPYLRGFISWHRIISNMIIMTGVS